MPPKRRARKGKKSREGGVPGTSPAEPSSSAENNSKDQYHHTVPRFVLRRFVVGERKKKAERIKEYRRTGVDPDEILVYDLTTKTLGLRLVGGIFGVKNLYRDIRDTQNVNSLEQKLSVLEGKVAIIIKQLHENLWKGEFSLMRSELENFRRFMFLMHYRNAALSHSYFDPTHPENASGRDHIEQMQTKLGLSSLVEVWLHFLRYFLDTPHHEIMAHAMKEIKKYGMHGVASMLFSRLDPAMEHFEAIAYQSMADAYYLCIWQAADGEEFVLGSNSFGLWEGLTVGMPGLHRVFVVSPQIVIVLRSNQLRKEVPQLLPVSSDLIDVESEPPTPHYKGEQPDSIEELHKRRASVEGKRDTFTFKITKLTHAQMNAVNFVTLDNYRPDTSFTFLSKEKMLRTIREFCQSPEAYRIPFRSVYRPLMEQLSVREPNSTEDMPGATA